MYKPNKKYSKQQNSDYTYATLDALLKFPGMYIDIETIKAASGCVLGRINTQKMGRILSNLSDMGIVKKKKDGVHMTYMTTITQDKNGDIHTPYETEDSIYGNYFEKSRPIKETPIEINWELDEERRLK